MMWTSVSQTTDIVITSAITSQAPIRAAADTASRWTATGAPVQHVTFASPTMVVLTYVTTSTDPTAAPADRATN